MWHYGKFAIVNILFEFGLVPNVQVVFGNKLCIYTFDLGRMLSEIAKDHSFEPAK